MAGIRAPERRTSGDDDGVGQLTTHAGELACFLAG
jgi:hypothetical protein